ncbi:MAG: hypothetical protein WCV88_03950 [Patescibacteria group bacterium]|jgi:hypothetical protein
MKYTPKTATGKWSIGLIILTPILFYMGGLLSSTMYSGVAAGNSISEDIANRPVLAYSMMAGMIAGIAACAFGLYAIVKQKETATLVYISTTAGALLMLFLIGELIFS